MNWYHPRCTPVSRSVLAFATFGFLVNPVLSQPLITEFLASNTIPIDTDNEASDWIEIHNPTSEAISLEGYTLSDNTALPDKWTFGSTTLDPGAYLLVFASGKDRQGGLDDIHTNFKLGAEGESLLLATPDGTVLSSFDFPPQVPDVSYGRFNDENQFFDPPTPGAPNEEGFLEFVSPPVFSMDRGFYTEPFDLTLETEAEGATIHYLLEGKDPAQGSIFSPALVYSEPIDISETTVVRAYVKHPDGRISKTHTQTYIFPADVVTQPNNPDGFPSSWRSIQADYAMDPRITEPNADQMTDALLSLPTVSFVGDTSDFFGSDGIYANPQSSGVAWERPISMEWMDPNGDLQFQIDCGVRIQGGYFRDPSATQKHSFRVLFKKIYGQGKLNQPIFNERGAAESFDTLIFRAGANDGYSWNAAIDTEQFIRDEFGRRLMLDMGNPSARGTFVHLYVNGLYWGMHNLAERPNEDFSSTYLGGEPEEWDSSNSGEVKSGSLEAWNAFIRDTRDTTTWADYQKLQGLNPDGSRNPEYPVYFDATNYVDYMITNLWGGNWDWPNKNFWFGRDRTENSTGFKFYTWDFENTMGNNRDRSPLNMVSPRNTTWVGEPYAHLIDTVWFQMDYADRVHKHFFNGGLLTPEVLIERYRALADRVELSILTESARWGDDHHGTPQTIDDWYRERDWMLNTYLPQRSDIVLQQFKNNKLYPPTAVAPTLNEHGGRVDHGFVAAFTEPSSDIHYTLDGSDPFTINPDSGAIELSESALLYEEPFPITSTSTVKARTYHQSIFGTVTWSALNEATFVVGSDDVVISEIMYHPTPPTDQEKDAGYREGNQFEYLILKNIGAYPVNLEGMQFIEGISFEFADSHSIAPDGTAILVSDSDAFLMRYGTHPIAGEFNDRLDNGGERLTLVDASGTSVGTLDYGDAEPWPEEPDGDGLSLSLVSPSERPDHEAAENWTSTSPLGGSNPVEGTSLVDWLASHELTESTADDDGDGLITFLEYALGTNPKSTNSASELFNIEFETRDGVPHTTVNFQRRTSLEGVDLDVQVSQDLENWEAIGEWFSQDGAPTPDGELETRRLIRPLTDPASPQLYIRLRGELSEP